MTVSLTGDIIRLEGDCRVEDAEPLLTLLQAGPGRSVDLTRTGQVHGAVFQVLLALQPPTLRPAGDAFVETWLSRFLS